MYSQQSLQSFILKEFDKYGFILRPTSLTILLSHFEKSQSKTPALLPIINLLRKLSPNNSILESHIITQALTLLSTQTISPEIDSKLKQNLIILEQKPGSYFTKNAIQKSINLEFRLNMIKSSLNPLIASQISEIGSLIGSIGHKKLIGVLFELEKDVYYLQDNLSKVRLDFSKCAKPIGFMVVGFILICDGIYNKDFFEVDSISHPQLIDKNNKLSKEYQEKIKKNLIDFQIKNPEKIGIFELPQDKELNLAIFSNFTLNTETFTKFDQVLKTIEQSKTYVILLIGEFWVEEIKEKREKEELELQLENFNQLISKYPRICREVIWLFMPGLNDLGLNVMPRKGLPEKMFLKMSEKIHRVWNGTNPMRFTIFGKEFVICRNDLIKEIRRNSLVECNPEIELDIHLEETIMGQRFLGGNKIAVVWEKEEEIRIERKPEFFILADNYCKQFERKKNDGWMINPGNFGKNGCFTMVYPNMELVHLCKI